MRFPKLKQRHLELLRHDCNKIFSHLLITLTNYLIFTLNYTKQCLKITKINSCDGREIIWRLQNLLSLNFSVTIMYFLFFIRDDLLSYLTNHSELWKLFLKLCTILKIMCMGGIWQKYNFLQFIWNKIRGFHSSSSTVLAKPWLS